jgi:nitrous oxidase accessory protein NosD
VARHRFGARYVIEVGTREHVTVRSRAPGGAARGGRRYDTITEALSGASAGDAVDVGPGRYTRAIGETFPLVVPAGVTLRAAAKLPASRVVIDAGGAPGVQLAGDDATLERVTVTGGAPGYMMIPPTCVISTGADRIVVRDCHVESIALTGGAGHRVIGNVIASGAVSLMAATGCEVRANYQHGLRWGVGIMIAGGTDHIVSDNECRDDLCAIRLANTERARVEHNRAETRWWGIHLLDARDTVVRSNQAWHTMRAIDVEGVSARGNVVDRQLAEHCDTGAMIERGATDTRVVDSWFHDCRVGLLVWKAGPVDISGTAISAPRDHAVVSDQTLDLAGNEIDGDVWVA